VTGTVVGQLLKLTLVSEVLPLSPLHTVPGCMVLSSHLGPQPYSSHAARRHTRELRSMENESQGRRTFRSSEWLTTGSDVRKCWHK